MVSNPTIVKSEVTMMAPVVLPGAIVSVVINPPMVVITIVEMPEKGRPGMPVWRVKSPVPGRVP